MGLFPVGTNARTTIDIEMVCVFHGRGCVRLLGPRFFSLAVSPSGGGDLVRRRLEVSAFLTGASPHHHFIHSIETFRQSYSGNISSSSKDGVGVVGPDAVPAYPPWAFAALTAIAWLFAPQMTRWYFALLNVLFLIGSITLWGVG